MSVEEAWFAEGGAPARPAPAVSAPHGLEVRRLALLATVVPVALGVFSGFQRRAYDSFIHMFFADHYLKGWFDVWEPRWYGGFSVVSYPPLAHQLIALLSLPLRALPSPSLEAGFVALTALVMVAMPFAVRSAALAFVDEEVADWAMLLAALWPTAHRFAYVFGQLPMLTATPLALFSLGRLRAFVESGRVRALVAYLALIGATAGAHHLTTVFAAGGAVLVAARTVLPAGPERGRRFLRAAVAGVGSAAMLYLVILPFWRFAAGGAQTEIPHVSRLAIWEREWNLDLVEQLVILAGSFAGLAWAALRKDRTLILLALGVVGLSLLALGATTPLPALLFRSQWRWLTYDKFHYWASLLWPILLAAALVAFRATGARVRAAIALVLIPPTMFFVGHQTSEKFQPEYVHGLEPLAAVLNGPEAERYRHLTLGFGDQFVRLDVASRSPNIDGNYHTARTDPALRQSGIATLDAAKYYAGGMEALSRVLAEAKGRSLRWVFSTDQAYEPPLFEAGFELTEVWPNGVTLYTREDVDPLPLEPRPPRGWPGYLWGFGPIGCLAIAALTVRRRAPARAAEPPRAARPARG